MKKIIILLAVVMYMQALQAQTMLDSVKNEIYRINKVFDSSRYLSFDLDIQYKGDSIEPDQLSGTYILNRSNLYYHMGANEYIQTDSFAYNIYSSERMMIMTKNFVPDNSDMFPLKTFIDSVVEHYGNSYVITIDAPILDSLDGLRKISFIDTSTININNLVPYASFAIKYQSDSYYPVSFEFVSRELAVFDSVLNDPTPPVVNVLRKVMSMTFSNYKAFANTEIFKDLRYVSYNRQRKIYEPAAKYREYRFITAGFNNEDAEAQYYREAPYSGN